MKKNTLGVLLVAPVVLSLLTFVTTTILISSMRVDIQDIAWNYKENVGFQIKLNADGSSEGVLLEAEAVYDARSTLSDGNNLVWYVKDETSSSESSAFVAEATTDSEAVCEIKQQEDGYYLYALNEGEATIVCENEKKTISKSFNAIVFKDDAIIINTTEASSGSAINDTRYYGQYNLSYDASTLRKDGYSKVAATLALDVEVYTGGEESTSYSVSSLSDNISYSGGVITFKSGGDAYITFQADSSSYGGFERTYSFSIVSNGVNIRSYDDMLRATNLSTNGEIAVMQISLGSLVETYKYTTTEVNGTTVNIFRDEYLSNNTRLFGHYDFDNLDFSFEDELYTFESDYSTKFIEQYNSTYSEDVSTTLKAGLHVQKSIYGNGFSINMHNLAYPANGSTDKVSGILTPDPEKDYFQGPLPFIFLGDPETYPLIEAFGQDNAGLYIDADNVTIDDLRIRNANDQDNRYDLTYTGTVVDIENAENVTLRNCVISNGKNIVRAFSTDGLTIDNCILEDSGEFLLHLGSNTYNEADKTKTISFKAGRGSYSRTVDGVSFTDYFDTPYEEGNTNLTADEVYTDLITSDDTTDQNREYLLEAAEATQDALDNTSGLINSDGSYNYEATVTVNDTSFASSGVYSIAMDTMFNGGYLYKGYPSMIGTMVGTTDYAKLVLAPDNIGGTSRPVHLNLEGDTKFYDWKNIDEINMNALIDENLLAAINTLAPSLNIESLSSLNIDDYFPIKAILKEVAAANGFLYTTGGVSYINTAMIYYGGGLNLSTIDNNITSTSNNFSSDEYALDMAHAYVYQEHIAESLDGQENAATFKHLVGILAVAVMCVTGSHDFKVMGDIVEEGVTPTLFDQQPTVEDLLD